MTKSRSGVKMERADKSALLNLPFILLLAAALALAGSQGTARAGSLPLFTLCLSLAFLVQWVAFVPAYRRRTERYFDLTGSLTYVGVSTLALLGGRPDSGRAWLLWLLVVIWALRLGLFLYRRIHQAGSDRRFDQLKQSPARFLLAWSLQGLWISFTLAAALAAMTSTRQPPLGLYALIGLFLWLAGFGLEVVADWQKSQFRSRPENEGRFISSGLWAWSRHPNYFGEILLWLGVAVIALPALQGWQYVTLVSPLFVILLLTRISGIPLLEARAEEKWGGQPAYEAYKARTPLLLPWPPSDKPDKSQVMDVDRREDNTTG